MIKSRAYAFAAFFIIILGRAVCGADAKDGVFSESMPNGVLFIHKHSKSSGIISMKLFLRQGYALEGPSSGGISVLMQNLMLKGTKRKNQKLLGEFIDDAGARISFGAEADYLECSLEASARNFNRCVKIFAEIIKEPAFEAENIIREKNSQKNAIVSRKDSIFNIAFDRLNSMVFEGHPYARLNLGTAESIENITREGLAAFHKTAYQPRNMIIVVAGDISRAEAKKLISGHFGSLKNTESEQNLPAPKEYEPYSVGAGTSVKAGFNQGYLMLGFLAPRAADEDYPALKLLNSVLGGGMSSRLFGVLREEHSLAYEVSSFYPTRKEKSAFVVYMGLDPVKIDEAEIKIGAELERLIKEPVGADELSDNKRYMSGTYLLSRQTNAQRAWYLGWWESVGLGYKYDEFYTDDILRVTSEKIKETAKKYFSNRKFTVKVLPE